QTPYSILFEVRYRIEQSSHLQKIKQLKLLIGTQCKEKIIRQTVNLELILKLAHELALEKKSNNTVTILVLIFERNEVKPFSIIEIDDIHQLAIKNGGDLIFKNDIVLKPSNLFKILIERIFRHWNLSLKSARRMIIDLYLLEAVDHMYDLKIYNIEDRLAIYPKYYIKPQNIENNLTLKGSVNYLTTERSEATITLLQARQNLSNNCVFCAVEAKKDESFAQGAGELLGQMKILHMRE
ncbi:32955_t:CDS:2, partial [Racocetra persica]